jgi:hypothetical protein
LIRGEIVSWGETVYRELTKKDSMEWSWRELRLDGIEWNPNLKNEKFGAFWILMMKVKLSWKLID